MRNTGKTTRMLVKLLDEMFNSKHEKLFVVLTPHSVSDCCYLQRKLSDLLFVLGIEHKNKQAEITYELKWNGEVLFIRTIKFVTLERWSRESFNITRGLKPFEIMYNN